MNISLGQQNLAPTPQISWQLSFDRTQVVDPRDGVPSLQPSIGFSASGPSREVSSRMHSGPWPGVGTQSMTVITPRPSPEGAKKAAQGLVNFAQVHFLISCCQYVVLLVTQDRY